MRKASPGHCLEFHLAGKIILVTGAMDGIGKAAATEFAKRGATLTIVGRKSANSAST